VKTVILKAITITGLVFSWTAGCKKARYGILKPDKGTQVTTNVTDQNSSFKFEATPGTASPNEAITFTGTCTSSQKHEITWDFGDKSAPETGDQKTHAYQETGAYTVTAVCTLANGHTLSASVKVTILTDDGNDNGNNPNQGPVQSTPVQSTPTQGTPGQSQPTQSTPEQQ
jgi:PKD repeat protein